MSNINEIFNQRVDNILIQYKAARHLLGAMDKITTQGLAKKLVEAVTIMVRILSMLIILTILMRAHVTPLGK